MKQRSSTVRSLPQPLPRRIVSDGWWLCPDAAAPKGVVLPFGQRGTTSADEPAVSMTEQDIGP